MASHLCNGKLICLSAVSANIMLFLGNCLNFQEKKVIAALLAFLNPYLIFTSIMQGKA